MRRLFALFLVAAALCSPAYAVQISTYPSAGTLSASDIIPMVRTGSAGGFQTSPAALWAYGQTHIPGTSGQILYNSNGSLAAESLSFQSHSAELDALSSFSGTGYPQRAGSGAWSIAAGIPYSALTGAPTIPTNTNQLTNGAGFVTSSALGTMAFVSASLYTPTSGLAAVALSGAYTSLTGRPTIPTAVSQLTNDSGFVSYNSATTYTRQQNFGLATLTDASTISWDLNLAQSAVVTLSGSHTIAAPTNQVQGGDYTLLIVEDGVGGWTPTFNSVFKWSNGVAPSFGTGAGKVNLVSCKSYAGNMLCAATPDLR